jgi:hypothetical protein
VSDTSRPEAEITEIIFPVQLSPVCDRAQLQPRQAAQAPAQTPHDYPILFMQLKNKTALMQGISKLLRGPLQASVYSGGWRNSCTCCEGPGGFRRPTC